MKTCFKQICFLGFVLHVFKTTYSQEQPTITMMNNELEMKTEGVAFLGSGMSEDDAKTFAINDAKRNALEQAGTYLESHTTVLNQKLVKDEVITFSAGLLKATVLHEERTLINNMFAFKVNISAIIDIKLFKKRITEVRNDSQLKAQLEEERERVKQLETRIAELQTDGKPFTKQEIKSTINELSANEWFNKAYSTENLSQRIEYYSKAIELNPNYAEAYNNRSIGYSELGNYNAAVLDCNKAIELGQQEARVYYNRGIAYSKWGNHSTAIQDYNKAIELNPQYAEAFVNRGLAYGFLGNYATAIRDYNKAIELGLQNGIVYFNRGLIYGNLGNYDTAIRDYNKAIELDPQDPEAYYWRGLAYGFLGNHEAAIRDLTKTIELNPQYADAYANRGVTYLKLHNGKEAVGDFNRYLRMTINKNNNGDAEKVRQWIRDLGYEPQY